MGILILLQMAIIRECIKMKGHVSTQSTDLKTELSNLGTLLDEAIDFIVDGGGSPKNSIVANTLSQPDFRELILGGLMSRIMMAPEHGSTTQPEERQIQQDNTQTLETSVQREQSSGDIHHQ